LRALIAASIFLERVGFPPERVRWGLRRLMPVPGVGPIISSAVVAAIGNGAGFKQGRDFGAWLGLVPKPGFVAVDRAGIEAAPPQHAGDRTCQQARPHRLERSCPWPQFRGKKNR
jgi:hypothetical protein